MRNFFIFVLHHRRLNPYQKNRSVMLDFVILIAIGSLLFSGCATFMAATSGSAPPDLTIVEVGATRLAVERELGKPKLKDTNVYSYEYNREEPLPLWGGVLIDVITLGTSFFYWGDMRKGQEAQRATLRIIYGPDDRVIGPSYDTIKSQFHEWLFDGNFKEKLESLCLAANAGYAPAQTIQAMRYRYGLWDTGVDNVQALLWLRLAQFGGQKSVSEIMHNWTVNMSPEEVSMTEKLFREWEPASCRK